MNSETSNSAAGNSATGMPGAGNTATGTAAPAERAAGKAASGGADGSRPAASGAADEPLSLDLHVMMARHQAGARHYDVLIIGSGYGGAVAAAELAGATKQDGKALRICVLERGNQYLPGMFPSRLAELPGHMRYAKPGDLVPVGLRDGLFDVRVGVDVTTLLGNGLGGGSLINAGVLEEPLAEVFARPPWPEKVRQAFGPGPGGEPDRKNGEFSPRFGAMAELLGQQWSGAADNNGIGDLPKRQRIAELGGKEFRPPHISMVLKQGGYTTCGGIHLNRCENCGDCMTGCNHGAKLSLDTSLLAKARRSAPDTLWLVTGATVLRLERDGGRWRVVVVHTDKLARQHQGNPYMLSADKVILAAGALGSTEILLRSRSPETRFSARLGQQYSTNGDNVVAIYGMHAEVNARADEASAPTCRARRVGPTITGVIDTTLDGPGGPGAARFLAEEFSIPGPLKRVFDEIFTTANLLDGMPGPDTSEYAAGTVDPAAVNETQLRRTMLLGINGHDPACGVMVLKSECGADDTRGDGLIDIKWPGLKNESLFTDQIKRVQHLLDELNRTAPDGGLGRAKILPNPLWRLLPKQFDALLGEQLGPILSVHPLGGCPMGDDAAGGAVDAYGRVFDESDRCAPGAAASWFGSLVVLDGAIVPTSLGANPSLTIATLARWAVQHLRDEVWQLRPAESEALAPRAVPMHARGPRVTAPPPPVPTEVVLRERLAGTLSLAERPSAGRVGVELTLKFQPIALAALSTGLPCQIPLAGGALRVYTDLDAWRTAREDGWSDQALDRISEATPLKSGSITMLGRLPGREEQGVRVGASLWPWWRNRGKRDIWQLLPAMSPTRRELAVDFVEFGVLLLRDRADAAAQTSCLESIGRVVDWLETDSVARRFRELSASMLAMASRAGAHRLIEYELVTEKNAIIRGVKTLGYAVASNPVMQLADLELTEFPGYSRAAPAATEPVPAAPWLLGGGRLAVLLSFLIWRYPGRLWRRLLRALAPPAPPAAPAAEHWDDDRPEGTLRLDTRYLARKRTPLVRIARQSDSPAAMAELASFGLYMARVLLPLHLWTFRQPDAAPAAPPGNSRLPGTLPGLLPPDVVELDVAPPQDDGTPVRLRLTRYRRQAGLAGDATPLLLIHGYSASGTTFAHPSIPLDLTRYFSEGNRGRDVWVLDLRTSCGMPTAKRPWTMEEVGRADIPLAVAHIRLATGEPKVDVLAHCVGCAMLSIAVLSPAQPGEPHPAARRALRQSIRSVVLSQYGPVVAVTPDNTLRAFVMAQLRHYANGAEYRFKPKAHPRLGAQLFDRLLAGLPARRADFDAENPADDDMVAAHRRSTPWTATRHRMDALYGRTFNPENMAAATLAAIDDFFGPMNMDTLAQMIHFARYRIVTDRQGNMVLDLPDSLPRSWTFPTLSLHSRENGMIDIASMSLMQKLFDGFRHHGYRAQHFAHLGHQDCLIGHAEATAPVFACIRDFFNRPPPPQQQEPAQVLGAFIPAMGPMLKAVQTRMVDGQLRRYLPFCVAASPLLPAPSHIVVGTTLPPALLLVAPAGAARDGWFDAEIDLDGLPPGLASASVMLIHDVPPWMAGSVSATPDPSLAPDHLYADLLRKLKEDLHPKEFAKCDIGFGAAQHDAPRSFVLASCQYSAGLLDEDVATASFRRMAGRVAGAEPADLPVAAAGTAPASPPAAFVLLVGDQIYADQTAGVFNPITRDDDDQRKYQLLYQGMELRKVLSRVPVWRMMDDHEIADNWEPSQHALNNAAGAEADLRRQTGIAKYWQNQRMTGPAQRAGRPRELYFWMRRRLGGTEFPFFVADSRSARQCRYPVAAGRDAHIMDAPQLARLCAWLDRQQRDGGDIPKFVAAPALFLPRLRSSVGAAGNPWDSQGWDGYPASLQRLLAHILDGQIKNVVFLSGDAHLSAWARADLRRPAGEGRAAASAVVHSIHSSGLYTPYPFANARWEDFMDRESFAVASAGGPAECSVQAYPAASFGSGFALITPYQAEGGHWWLGLEFDLESDLKGGLQSGAKDGPRGADMHSFRL